MRWRGYKYKRKDTGFPLKTCGNDSLSKSDERNINRQFRYILRTTENALNNPNAFEYSMRAGEWDLPSMKLSPKLA